MIDENTKIFGGRTLYPHQQKTCSALLAGRDVLLVSPTGSGKSFCYLLPTRTSGKSTLIISPLIALMEDQVNQARGLGFKAAALHSGVSLSEQWRILSRWMSGEEQLLFTSPERLGSEKILKCLKVSKPGLIAIDEAHCVETWGKRFRPMYQGLMDFIRAMRPTPILAMTATATQSMQGSIAKNLGMAAPQRVNVPFLFSKVSLSASQAHGPEERLKIVCSIAQNPGNLPMLIFCQSRHQVENVARELMNALRALGSCG